MCTDIGLPNLTVGSSVQLSHMLGLLHIVGRGNGRPIVVAEGVAFRGDWLSGMHGLALVLLVADVQVGGELRV